MDREYKERGGCQTLGTRGLAGVLPRREMTEQFLRSELRNMKLLDQDVDASKVRRLALRMIQTYCRCVEAFLRVHHNRTGQWIHPNKRDQWEVVFPRCIWPSESLRHACATQMPANGCDMRTVRKLIGNKDVATIMIYIYVMAKPGLGMCSPLDGSVPTQRDL